MTKEEIIRNLKYTMEKHKNDIVNTFDTNISVMCKDILDYFEEQERKYNMDNYVDAIIRIKVPEWQIGEEVGIYFKDSMHIKGICEEEEDKDKYKIKRMNVTGDIY